jgi:hypothetical protein
MMFGWFRRKPDPKLDTAFRKGQQIAQQTAAELDRFIEQGLSPYREYHLKRIDELVLDGIGSSDMPPIINARRVYAQFLETLTEYRGEVRSRTETHLKDALEIADMMQMRDKFEELITKRLGDFDAELRMSGLKVLTDRADMLKEFDDQWRAENPEKAAQFPSD